jgi:hypothetical protein
LGHIQETFRECPGNMQGKFKEHSEQTNTPSRNVQRTPTYLQGMFRKHPHTFAECLSIVHETQIHLLWNNGGPLMKHSGNTNTPSWHNGGTYREHKQTFVEQW